LFVGLSLNLAEVLKYPGVPARAAVTLGLTIAILLTAIFVATPGQDHRVLAAEIAVVGICVAAGALIAGLYQREKRSRARTLYVTLLPLVPALMLILGAVSLWLQRGGGLYWVTASVATGFVAATANAWVLLVEIKR
jgi:modulator of FtsH protease